MKVEQYEESEAACIDQLLACSGREFKREKQICVNNWDEVRSWKSVSPMGVYKKTKKKSLKTKQSKMVVPNKVGNYSVTFSPCRSDVFPYRYRFSETGKTAHSSTNVLSYSSPSWRYIVDWKSYSYVERKEPDVQVPKVNDKNSSVAKRTQSFADYNNSSAGSSTDIGSDYSLSCRVNPSDIIDDQIATAYVESLQFDMDNYDEEELRRNLILRPVAKLPVASIDDNVHHTVLVEQPKSMRKKPQRDATLNLCIKTVSKVERKESKKFGGSVGGGNKKNKKKRRRDVIKFSKMTLPPIPQPKVETIKRREEFPFAIAQILTSSGSSSNFEKRLSKWKESSETRKLVTSPPNAQSATSNHKKSIEFYLPTLKYGNYIHLIQDSQNKSDASKQKYDVLKQKSDASKQISDVKLPNVGENNNVKQLTSSTSSSADSL